MPTTTGLAIQRNWSFNNKLLISVGSINLTYRMDWTTIIVAVISAFGGGGLAFLFTRKETKEGMTLDNMQKVIDAKDRIIEEREARCKELKADLAKKDETIAQKEQYITDLHKDNSTLYDKLDKANSRAAVNKLLKCQEIGCSHRRPPLGEGAADTFRQIRNGNLGDEENGKGDI